MDVESLKIKENSAIFLNNLRSQTQPSHKKLESLPISRLLIHQDITIDAYAQYLQLMYTIVFQFEQHIFPVVEKVVPDSNKRKKSFLLLRDLKHINAEKINLLPLFTNAPHDFSVPFALGMLYVLEGSTLGGRFILKNIQENLRLDEENGASYFAGYGNKTGSYWKQFLQFLTEYESITHTEKEIIAGADYAFRVIENHLSKNSTF
ncbi:MAG TPA: biliverdin-producing heme oxygenase [Flavobacterium sp.]|jgi:heme oxygenase